ncbi:MAG: adenylate kinase [Candidatus Riflebacteria bacterium HGW-Riflebacteria-1]|jgi:adenylate kinase|nr:MAG: adenylate kinase [Candidatus Riflebacteria bacterium HGW-Riflebacteria-1]
MSKRNLNLIFLGPPGAGKGTQAKMIVDKYSIPQLSTGDLMRAAVSSGSPIGDKVKGYMAAGALVPDDLVVDILLDRLSGDDCRDGFILDGFPRTVGQAESLEAALKKRGMQLSGVVAMIVPDEALLARLTARRICRECSTSYHLEFLKPKVEGKCDRCQGELYQRKDDSEEVILNRLKVYHDQTAPLIDFYQTRKKLYTVDGNKKIEMIFSEICDIIDSLN